MVVVNEAGEIVLINSQTDNLFGFTRDELLGHWVEDLLPARFRDPHLATQSQIFLGSPRKADGSRPGTLCP